MWQKSFWINMPAANCLFLLLLLPSLLLSACSAVPPRSTASRDETTLVKVYFTDMNRYAQATPPYEVPVFRAVSARSNLPRVVLEEFFRGPTEEERRRGLEAIRSGFSGIGGIDIENGVAHVYLTGRCGSGGATYTAAQPITANLLQFEEIQYVKIYDAEGNTEEPSGRTNSIPLCLEP